MSWSRTSFSFSCDTLLRLCWSGPEVALPEGEEFPLPEEFSLADLQASPYEYAAGRDRREFQPWHRPRKQYVRDRQWTKAVDEILQSRDPADRLKYVGLPGTDLLDLRHLLKTVCEPSGRSLQYMGFDLAAGSGSIEGTELEISQSELLAAPLVHSASLIRPDDLRYVGSTSTAAWRAVKSMAPVDVVNLDLTTSVLSAGNEGGPSYLDALRELLAFQITNRHPWLLLLTTKVDRTSVSMQWAERVVQVLVDAIEKCTNLDDVILAYAETLPAVGELDSCRHTDFRLFTLAGLIKWLRDLTYRGAVRARPRVTSCFYYTSFATGGAVDMASLVIRFQGEPVVLGDNQVTDQPPRPLIADPCEDLERYLRRFGDGSDIDEVVRQDGALRQDLTTRSADLLTEARYPRERYLHWAEAQAS